MKARSAEGLSLTSNVSELLAFTVRLVVGDWWLVVGGLSVHSEALFIPRSIAYNMKLNYPFNTYGDSFPCWLQDIVIIALILKVSEDKQADTPQNPSYPP